LIIKKKFKPNFKEFILNNNLSNEDKVEKMNDEYFTLFDEISNILDEIEL
jgi:hypothetical protein